MNTKTKTQKALEGYSREYTKKLEAQLCSPLYASAPKMLEALEAVLNMGDDYEAEKLVREAIAKAKGE